jgi:hypothetical protein
LKFSPARRVLKRSMVAARDRSFVQRTPMSRCCAEKWRMFRESRDRTWAAVDPIVKPLMPYARLLMILHPMEKA